MEDTLDADIEMKDDDVIQSTSLPDHFRWDDTQDIAARFQIDESDVHNDLLPDYDYYEQGDIGACFLISILKCLASRIAIRANIPCPKLNWYYMRTILSTPNEAGSTGCVFLSIWGVPLETCWDMTSLKDLKPEEKIIRLRNLIDISRRANENIENKCLTCTTENQCIWNDKIEFKSIKLNSQATLSIPPLYTERIKIDLYTNGPMVLCLNVFDASIENNHGVIISFRNQNYNYLGHAMLVIGFNIIKDFYKVKNILKDSDKTLHVREIIQKTNYLMDKYGGLPYWICQNSWDEFREVNIAFKCPNIDLNMIIFQMFSVLPTSSYSNEPNHSKILIPDNIENHLQSLGYLIPNKIPMLFPSNSNVYLNSIININGTNDFSLSDYKNYSIDSIEYFSKKSFENFDFYLKIKNYLLILVKHKISGQHIYCITHNTEDEDMNDEDMNDDFKLRNERTNNMDKFIFFTQKMFMILNYYQIIYPLQIFYDEKKVIFLIQSSPFSNTLDSIFKKYSKKNEEIPQEYYNQLIQLCNIYYHLNEKIYIGVVNLKCIIIDNNGKMFFMPTSIRHTQLDFPLKNTFIHIHEQLQSFTIMEDHSNRTFRYSLNEFSEKFDQYILTLP